MLTSIPAADGRAAKSSEIGEQFTEEEMKIDIGLKQMLYCIWILGML